MQLQVIDKVKVTHQGEGHIKVKKSTSLPNLCSPYGQQAGGLRSTEMRSCLEMYWSVPGTIMPHLVRKYFRLMVKNFI